MTTASLVEMWVGKAIIKSSTITTILFTSNFIFPPKPNQYLRHFTQHARKYITILIIHLLMSIVSSKTSEFLELPPPPHSATVTPKSYRFGNSFKSSMINRLLLRRLSKMSLSSENGQNRAKIHISSTYNGL